MSNKKLLFFYHLLRPIVDLKLTTIGLTNYFSYLKDLWQYQKLEKDLKIPFWELNPKLYDKAKVTPVDYHYFYQQLWVFKKVLEAKPARHLEVGSTYELSAYLAQIVPTTFLDLRPIAVKIPNLTVQRDDLLNLPFADNFWESVSSLHVVEHIGLGRYGDSLDPQGTQKACAELTRILKPAGRLYFSVPIGWQRICFNAHRVFNPQTILDYFSSLKLLEFCVVDDEGSFHENIDHHNFVNLDYGCGMFEFMKI